MGEGYCKKCGEKIKKKHSLSNKLCGLCADDELNAHKCNCQKFGIEMISTRNPLPTLCSSCERDELNFKSSLPWNERLPMLSINPDAATRHDVARMSAELMECRKCLSDVSHFFSELNKEQ